MTVVRVAAIPALHYLFLVRELVNVFGNFEAQDICIIYTIAWSRYDCLLKIFQYFLSFLLNEQLLLQVIANFIDENLIDKYLKLHNGIDKEAQPDEVLYIIS